MIGKIGTAVLVLVGIGGFLADMGHKPSQPPPPPPVETSVQTDVTQLRADVLLLSQLPGSCAGLADTIDNGTENQKTGLMVTIGVAWDANTNREIQLSNIYDMIKLCRAYPSGMIYNAAHIVASQD